MGMQNFHFTVGAFKCIVVNDGALSYTMPARVHFPNAPSDQLGVALRKYGVELDLWKEWISPLPCLIIQTGMHRVLVDTGLGKADFAPEAGKLLQNLQVAGIQPGDIDIVILSHAHGDHIGGNVDPMGKAAFPNARYVMRKEEWDFWTSEEILSQPGYEWMTPFVHGQLLPLFDRFELLTQDTEIVPGIQTLFAPGHTPGNMALSVFSDGERLLCLGDVMTHPIHLEQPDWYIAPDCQPEQSLCTRRWLLERAADEQARVFAFHFDFPGLGTVRKSQGAWQWQPMVKS